jgi:hypothetical protein
MSRHSVSLILEHGEGFYPADDTFRIFDPFWTAEGIFHDVFEHYFEFKGKFKDCTSVYGEMMATAHKIWLWENIGFSAFDVRSSKPHIGMNYREDTSGFLEDTYEHETYSFDWPLIAKHQRPVDCWKLEESIKDYKDFADDLQEWVAPVPKKEFIARMRDSYRFGYRMAYKRFGHVPVGKLYTEFTEFLWSWHHFIDQYKRSIDTIYICDRYSASQYELRGLKVVSHLGTKDCSINQYAIGKDDYGVTRTTKFDIPGDVLSTL